MKTIILSILSLFASVSSFSQNKFELGKVYTLPSKVLNENRTLNVYTPEGYHSDSSKTYPIIYLLDGSANEDFIHIVGIVQFLTMIEAMPKTIVVGIANVDRKRDFTFPTSIEKDRTDFPTTGKSSKFIRFIEEELHPFVKKTFKTNNTSTIIGQSLGGLLASEILLKKSALFDQYIIVSPSLWWDNESLLTYPFNEQKKAVAKVFIAVGEEGDVMKNDAKKLATLLTKYKGLNVSFEFFEKEDHLTILHNSVYQALLKMYSKN